MDADDTLRVLSRLIPHLGLDQPVYGFQPRWLDGHSERYSGAEETASELLADLKAVQPKGPYLLGGDCAGGIVAFVMAQKLLQLGDEVRLLVMSDTYRPSALSALGLRLFRALALSFTSKQYSGAFIMEFRQLGGSGLKVPALCLGTGTFGGKNEFFSAWGVTEVEEATKLVDISLEAGLSMFDSADVYSDGSAEEILGKAIKGRRDQVIISTKATFRSGPGHNDVGSSRHHLINACEASLRRLGTDYIDLYQMHGFDALSPIEETLSALDDMVHSGKVRYIGCSNFSGWHLMKSLAVSEKYGLSRYVAHQAYYSLVGRDYEWELMPLALDQKVGTVVWSPLGWGRLTGKIRRAQPLPEVSRLHSRAIVQAGPPIADEYVYRVVDTIDEVAKETGKTAAQIAINWLLQRPTVATVIIGARNADQLRQNLGAVDWNLTPAHFAKLDASSATTPIYPYWHQRGFAERNPSPV
jgi:aryl-alcohol dehydrogenase-like predicted oxidoreductase